MSFKGPVHFRVNVFFSFSFILPPSRPVCTIYSPVQLKPSSGRVKLAVGESLTKAIKDKKIFGGSLKFSFQCFLRGHVLIVLS